MTWRTWRLAGRNPFFIVQELRAFWSTGKDEQMNIVEAVNSCMSQNTELKFG